MGNEVSTAEDYFFNMSDIPMPWFGLDIGGTLAKLVYFEPTDGIKTGNDDETLNKIRRYFLTPSFNRTCGQRDTVLQMDGVEINGRIGSLHFIRFPTSKIPVFIEMTKAHGLLATSNTKDMKEEGTVCSTGGGTYKFERDFERICNLKLHKFDEIDSLVRGVQYIEAERRSQELFYFSKIGDSAENCVKTAYDSDEAVYPFMLVNIGSGVSILSVKGPDDYKRVSGTSLGGGTFLGLCCLLTGCKTFEDALDLASKGDNRNADKLVKDIYGGDYSRFGLSGDTVASSFGHMNSADKRNTISREDLARACLVTITNNIGSIARLCAQAEKAERVLFVGNFLRINPISMKMLATAMEYWSGGAMKALFCKHEGYFGAIGCLLQLMKTKKSP